ncbi:BREX system P-loop protein BrxC [Anoxynatronum buryatiense]|uniref:BREX system P-loop protein BrxC n=1 Tax=Anoxynatronum buryatiense TaxID=489973 RepID=A0AA45WZ34_9CLOT|nr:BREX system P-loop protein BrxC [Anoxynatronum buryatiense]SMP72058.1 hypothetical protein SAMN06296020_12513 [Anoxynatronum buryatiense]
MKLRSLFSKKIDRDIKGVIKIGQKEEADVQQELEEYVVTRELNRHFNTFFDSYKTSINHHTDKMGVWISGFFGSGKSHFIKILSYLLENKSVSGKTAVNYFNDKISDPMVRADMQKAGSLSSDVILFNIDSKSDADSKTTKESIVRVFNKVFDEMQGFCGSIPWLADLERQLVKEGSYDAFRSRYEALSNSTWQETREDFYFEEDNIVQALADTTRMSAESARSWYKKADENYSLSVEKFATRVRDYIESKGKEHHVIFLVDEMGQYIGDDVGLMLNLQTVVEDLGTHCGGKAWVIVTSQQDIDTVTRVKGNDFSKIQGRFNTRLSLSSANVDEVIKRRILAKTDVAADTLKLVYAGNEAVLKNLITFSSDTPEMKTYTSSDDFIDVYPFIPYQFRLLQSVFTAVRQHGASGKHLSEGERSLLSAFQEAAIQYADGNVGTLIPFSAFFETIEAFLDHNIRTVVLHAEDNDRLSSRDVEVLKVLFLVKWVNEKMPSNMENIATLMISHMEQDKIELKKEVEASLARLLKENLIQKNGSAYIFLTHEEQDVNREIQNMQVDTSEVIGKVGDIIFNALYTEKKFRYNTRYHFDFNKIIDDRYIAPQKHELGVKVLTPYYDAGLDISESELKMMASREKQLIIHLPSDLSAMEEMENILKIQAYLQQKGGTAATETHEEIKARKSREVAERKERLNQLLIFALQEADYYVNTQKLDIKSKSVVDRINTGLKVLIEGLYTKLHYVNQFIEGSKDLQDLLYKDEWQLTLDISDEIPNKLALDDLQDRINISTDQHIPLTLKGVLDHYLRPPYGWLPDDIRGLVIRLFRDQKIKLQLGGDFLENGDPNLYQYLTRKDAVDRILLSKRTETPKEQLQNARFLMKEVFGKTMMPSDEDGLMRNFKEQASEELSYIRELLVRYEQKHYPGKDILDKGKALMKEITGIKEPATFYQRVYEKKKDLLEYEETSADVKNFFKNQRKYFDDAVEKVKIYDRNRTYIMDQEVKECINKIKAIVQDSAPYNQIAQLPGHVEQFYLRFAQLLEERSKPIEQTIQDDWCQVEKQMEESGLHDALNNDFHRDFQRLREKLKTANNFNEIIAMKEESNIIRQQCLEKIDQELKSRKPEVKDPGPDIVLPPKPVVTRVRLTINDLYRGNTTIETEADIEKVLEQLRKQLKEQLKENTILELS